MIEVKDLEKGYKVNEEYFPVLKAINCTINDGEFVSILGPSGCGKSTFLNILAGLMHADNGQIVIDGKETSDYSDEEWDVWRRNKIGIVFQSFHLIPHLSALQNVELAMSVAAYGKRERRARAKELLRRVGLEGRMRNKPGQLSGGQKQRVAIARALANNPKAILADEPTGALDSATSKEIMDLLHSLNQNEGVTIIMVTHDESIAANTERNIRMLDGDIVEDVYLKNVRKKQKKVDVLPEKQQKTRNMKWIDTLSVALRNIRTKRKRVLLTTLGIAVGMFSIVSMLGITNGVSYKVSAELDDLSKASVIRVVTSGKSESKISELKNMLSREGHVTSMEEVYTFAGLIVMGESYSEEVIYSVTGVEPKEELLYGKYPDAPEEIAVSESVAEQFAGGGKTEDILGKEVQIYVAYSTDSEITYEVEKKCTVVGITPVNIFGNGNNYVDYFFAKEIAAESVGKDVEAQNLYVNLDTKESRRVVLSRIEDDGFVVASSEETIKSINGWIGAIKNFLLLITGIAMVVALVMVIIVQYMSVAERSREIGIFRAIGAGKQDIRNIFLLEAGVIGTVSGTLGIVTACIFGSLVNDVVYELMKAKAFEVYRMHMPTITVCMLVSIVLCLLAGYMPARQAATVDTIEVLR